MELNEKVKYTKEGYWQVVESLTQYPEDKRHQMFKMLLDTMIR